MEPAPLARDKTGFRPARDDTANIVSVIMSVITVIKKSLLSSKRLSVIMNIGQLVTTTFFGAALLPLGCVRVSVEPTRVSCSDYDHERFDERETAILIKGDVDPATANEFGRQFPPQRMVYLHQKGVSPTYANTYPLRFGGIEVAAFATHGISAEQAGEYDERFDGLAITAFVGSEIPAVEAQQYDPRFRSLDLRYMAQEGMRPAEGNGYDPLRFRDIWFLVAKGIAPSVTDTFPPEMNEQAIVFSLDH